MAYACDGLATACDDGFRHLLGGHGAGNALLGCEGFLVVANCREQLEAITNEVEGRQERAGITEYGDLASRLYPSGLGKPLETVTTSELGKTDDDMIKPDEYE